MPNARGDGVFYEDLGHSKWKIRWRQKKAGGGYRNRSMTIECSALHRDKAIVEVRDSLATRGTYEPDMSEVMAPASAAATSVLDLLVGCIEARRVGGKYAGKTPSTYTSYARRLADSIHRILNIPEDHPIPVSVLSRDLFIQIQRLDDQRSASKMMRYCAPRLLLDAWRWAHAENVEARENRRPERWPLLPTAPTNTKDYLPRTPKYGRTIAPSITHIDACLRCFPNKVNQGTRVGAILMRYTGLRSQQIFSVMRQDVSLTERSLYVRSGKTEQEKEDARTIPLAEAFFREPGVLGWIETTRQGEPLFPKRRHTNTDRENPARSKQPTVTFKAAWEAATEAGEVPRHVWAPPNRTFTRPEHGFRAAFQAFLTEQRVPADVIDFLVGHQEGTVRDMHYGRDLLDAARDAVNLIPQIDWVGPGAKDDENVVRFERKSR